MCNNAYNNIVPCVCCPQVLRGRPFLSVREQDPVRVRLRGAAGVRQHGHVQFVQSGAHKKASRQITGRPSDGATLQVLSPSLTTNCDHGQLDPRFSTVNYTPRVSVAATHERRQRRFSFFAGRGCQTKAGQHFVPVQTISIRIMPRA